MHATLQRKASRSRQTLAAPPGVQAATCVAITLFDQNGAVVSVPMPVVGLMLGGTPVIGAGLPPHFSRKSGSAVPCPEVLLERIRDLFNASCPAEDRRNQAAATNRSSVEEINRGCANMAEALSALPTQ